MFTYRGCRKSFRVGVLLTNLSWWKILYLVHYLVIIPSTSLYCGNLLTLLSNETNTRLHIWIICRYTYLRYKVKVWATSENPFAGGRLSKSLPHWEPRKLKSLVCKKLRETVHFPLSPQHHTTGRHPRSSCRTRHRKQPFQRNRKKPTWNHYWTGEWIHGQPRRVWQPNPLPSFTLRSIFFWLL